MLDTKSKFNRTFNNSCQQESVPESLKTLIGMILGGTDIKTQSSDLTEAQTSLSISQLMLFNATKRRRDSGTTVASYYHSRDREPPLPIYLGLMTHAETRKRTLVDKLYNLGLSISYDRVLESSTDMGTTTALDNIDHNSSSVTAQGAFHGTGISLFQHPTSDAPREKREVVNIDNQPSKTKRLARLPDSYTAVRPVILPKNSSYIVGGTKAFFSKCFLTKPNYISTFHLMVIFYGNLYVFISYAGKEPSRLGKSFL